MKNAMSSLEKLKNDVLNCEICAKLPHAGKVKVFGRGNSNAKIMIVGEAPGQAEERQGRPFVGRAGELLEKMLKRVGVNSDTDIYITNSVKTRSYLKTDGNVKNIAPSAVLIAHGRIHLDAEIALVRPKLIVTLGSTASRMLLGRGFRLFRQRGRFYKLGDAVVLPTYHPAYVARFSGKRNLRIIEEFTGDLKKAKEFTERQS